MLYVMLADLSFLTILVAVFAVSYVAALRSKDD